MDSDRQHSYSLAPSDQLDQSPPLPTEAPPRTTSASTSAHHVTSVATSQHSGFPSSYSGSSSSPAKPHPPQTTPGPSPLPPNSDTAPRSLTSTPPSMAPTPTATSVPPPAVPSGPSSPNIGSGTPPPTSSSGPPPTTIPPPSSFTSTSGPPHPNIGSDPPPHTSFSGPPHPSIQSDLPPHTSTSGPPPSTYYSIPPPSTPGSSQTSVANLPPSVSTQPIYGAPTSQHRPSPSLPSSEFGELTVTSVAPPTYSTHHSPGHDHNHPPSSGQIPPAQSSVPPPRTQPTAGYHSLPTSDLAQLRISTTTSHHSLPTSFQYSFEQHGNTSSGDTMTAQRDRGHPLPPSGQFYPPPPPAQYPVAPSYGYVNPPGPSGAQPNMRYSHHLHAAGPPATNPHQSYTSVPSQHTSYTSVSGPYTQHYDHQQRGHFPPPPFSFEHTTSNPHHPSFPPSNLPPGALPSQYAPSAAGYPPVGHPPPQLRPSSHYGHSNVGAHQPANPVYPSHGGPCVNFPPHMPGSRDPAYSQQQVRGHEQGATGVPSQTGKVFILYCKDPQLPKISDDVLDLADILSHCGGFSCMVDHYVDVPPPNWSIWTEQRIRESQFVILVYSPTLYHLLMEPCDYILEMENGKYYLNTIINFVHSQPHKFIPVFLNQHIPRHGYLQSVPSQLHTSSAYCLNVSELSSALSVPEEAPRYVFDEKLRQALNNDRFREMAKLVCHLRGESATSSPVPPQIPIPITPESQSLIPESELETIAKRMSRDWFALGIKLQVGITKLQNLQKKHSGKDQACLDMLRLWQQTKGKSATRKALKDVLVKMEYGRLAKELFPDV